MDPLAKAAMTVGIVIGGTCGMLAWTELPNRIKRLADFDEAGVIVIDRKLNRVYALADGDTRLVLPRAEVSAWDVIRHPADPARACAERAFREWTDIDIDLTKTKCEVERLHPFTVADVPSPTGGVPSVWYVVDYDRFFDVNNFRPVRAERQEWVRNLVDESDEQLIIVTADAAFSDEEPKWRFFDEPSSSVLRRYTLRDAIGEAVWRPQIPQIPAVKPAHPGRYSAGGSFIQSFPGFTRMWGQ